MGQYSYSTQNPIIYWINPVPGKPAVRSEGANWALLDLLGLAKSESS